MLLSSLTVFAKLPFVIFFCRAFLSREYFYDFGLARESQVAADGVV